MWDATDRRASRKVALLFAVTVLFPAAIFGVLIVRAVRSDRMQAVLQILHTEGVADFVATAGQAQVYQGRYATIF